MRKARSGKLVVVTHHAPLPDRHHRQSADHPSIRLNVDEILAFAYHTDLRSLMRPTETDRNFVPADLWIYGHTHESEDVTIGHTRAVSNAKGYGPWAPQLRAWDNPRFNPNYVIEI
jgi:hypothetical protein